MATEVKNVERNKSPESNAMVASSLFLAAILSDALTAHTPSTASVESPTSLRATSVILMSCLASPPIKDWMVMQQRVVILSLLTIIAFVGLHEQTLLGRLIDVTFLVITLGFIFGAYLSTKKNKNGSGDPKVHTTWFIKRESMNMLAIAQMLYASLRTIRVAFMHPELVRSYTVDLTVFDGSSKSLQGYAYASATSTASLAAGGVGGASVAVFLIVNHNMREIGTASATLVLLCGAIMQFTAAFVATMATSEQFNNLNAVFHSDACGASCTMAQHARRFAQMNGASTSLWISGFGTLVLAFAPSLRLRPNVVMLDVQRNVEAAAYAMLSALICIATLLSYLSFSGADAFTDYAVVAAFVGIMTNSFIDSPSGSLIFLLAIGGDLIMIWRTHGAEPVFVHFTHCVNVTALLFLTLHQMLTMFIDCAYLCLSIPTKNVLDRVSGCLVVAGTSLSVLLYLASCALMVSYDGSLIGDDAFRDADNRYERTSAAFIMNHYMPIFIWLPLYACRCDVEFLQRSTRVIVWCSVAFIPLAVWAVFLIRGGLSLDHTNQWYTTGPFIVSFVLIALVPWTSAVFA
mgnify:CR=1 FL=1|tara:strand:- start:551 stop:2275 length:1725 start_codon:yes stop_codon:yes gene_type:complete